MSFPKYTQLSEIQTISKAKEEIFFLEKSLFELRLKKLTTKQVKSHLFRHTKRRIAQLKTKLTEFEERANNGTNKD